ncbi:rho guanine nucleotide exchange factor 7-like protein [Labeo rohita]|uniref:Rho guanine nucleotide exchange factor 7-like protein n=1 Tax=Labeo rohita TaxID=84645 RepID=A0A498NCR0_LABRO|nr:rho guanine nucleotide exchange factor 7-like protein [Labeo rohita]
MGCCSVTQRHTGTDEVGPDEIELLEINNAGLWSLSETRLQISTRNGTDEGPHHCPSVRHLKQEAMSERYLVLFSFHLLILALDNLNKDFIYEGILPLSAIEVHLISQQDPSSPHMFEISGPMVDSKIFVCATAAETKTWMENIEDRRYKSLRQQLSPSHSALSYLVPCDENWKREELKRYLLRSPILQWEGMPIQHMGYPRYLSLVHISNVCIQDRLLQGAQERLLVLFPSDLLILSLDCHRVRVKYEGRLPLKSIKAMERSALPGRLEFEVTDNGTKQTDPEGN